MGVGSRCANHAGAERTRAASDPAARDLKFSGFYHSRRLIALALCCKNVFTSVNFQRHGILEEPDMAATTIRIREKSHMALKEMAALTGESLQDVLDQAIEDRRRKLYLEGVNADYAALKRNSKAWADFKKETALWDVTNLDGLDGL
jgi:predicted CopG family antitoxin